MNPIASAIVGSVIGSAVQAPAPVRYQTDAMGVVYRVRILSAAEIALAENR